MTSIGVTTATASVMPAARPAKMEMFVSGHVYVIDQVVESTEECCLPADCACCFVRKKLLVYVVGREANGHFRNNACEDGTEAFVESERSLPLDNLFPGC
jgi:hypothetical protein